MGNVLRLALVKAGDRVLDVGCGNGAMAGRLLDLGCDVVGIDLSEQGIRIAREQYPRGRFEVMMADSDILDHLGEEPFDVVISTEVVEHLYDPGSYLRGCYGALRFGGRFICSTPYHGYLKNLTLSVLNAWDSHWHPSKVGGHIKFWSRTTLSEEMSKAGFLDLGFRGAGRLPYLWKSMILTGEKLAAP